VKLVAVTGATSQIGRLLVPKLVAAGYQILAGSRRAVTPAIMPAVTWVQLDLGGDAALPPQLAAAEILIHLAPIEALPAFLQRAPLTGLRRMLVFSTTSADTKANSTSARERAFARSILAVEAMVQSYCDQRQIAWTIFRPTLIYGLGLDNNVALIARFIQRFGFFPLLSRGAGLRQPVHAADLAEACLAALDRQRTYGQTYYLGGADVLTYRTMVERIYAALGRRPRFLRAPAALLRLGLRGLSKLPWFAYLTPEMADRMNQDMVFDLTTAVRDFGYQPRAFQPLASELIYK